MSVKYGWVFSSGMVGVEVDLQTSGDIRCNREYKSSNVLLSCWNFGCIHVGTKKPWQQKIFVHGDTDVRSPVVLKWKMEE